MGSRHILIVDDDADSREGVAELLTDEGCAIAIANNGREAQGALEARPLPDLVLFDLEMPVLDGLGLVPEIGRDARFGKVKMGSPALAARGTLVGNRIGI